MGRAPVSVSGPLASRGITPELPITGCRRKARMLFPDLLICFLVIPIDPPTRSVEYLESASSGAEEVAGGEKKKPSIYISEHTLKRPRVPGHSYCGATQFIPDAGLNRNKTGCPVSGSDDEIIVTPCGSV